jgi:pimeloyl-ACP methyl ester carboxylesterase
VHVHGAGPAVVLLASLGRGADDFADLGTRLAEAGFCALAPEPRGVGASASPLHDVTMANLADDVVAVIRALADGPATVVGHAFGNRVARMVAARQPDVVESVILLACGGLVPPAVEVTAAMASVFDASLEPASRLDAIARAFFARATTPRRGKVAGTATRRPHRSRRQPALRSKNGGPRGQPTCWWSSLPPTWSPFPGTRP